MPFNHWDDLAGDVFGDQCSLARKKEMLESDATVNQAERLRAPGMPGIAPEAASLLNVRNALGVEKRSSWSERILSCADKSGESKSMAVGRRFINASDAQDSSMHFSSAEVRTREFIDRQMNGIGTRPKKVQATFMMSTAMMCAANIAGDDWRHIGPQICKERGWPFKKMYRLFLGSAPRRMGKTRFASMMLLNYALSLPGSTVIVFSTSQSTSNLLRTDMEKILQEQVEMEFAGRRYEISDLIGSKNNQNEWRLRSPYNPRLESVIYFNPGLNPQNANKKRGQGNDNWPLIFVDECAFIDVRSFVNVIVPILWMVGAIFIGVSSPAVDEFNFFTRLQHIKYANSNQRVCLTVKAELVCPRCKRRNLEMWCTHYNSMLPDWISSEQQYINRLIMKSLNMEDAAKREIGGMAASMENHAFPLRKIKKLRNRPLFRGTDQNKPEHIGVFVDPNAAFSEMAIVSICLVRGAFVVCYVLLLCTCICVLTKSLFATVVHALVFVLLLESALSPMTVPHVGHSVLQLEELVAHDALVVCAQRAHKMTDRLIVTVEHIVARPRYVHRNDAADVRCHDPLVERAQNIAAVFEEKRVRRRTAAFADAVHDAGIP